MPSLSNQDLIAYNAKGFIPGPNENEEKFLQRIELCQKIMGKQEESLKSTDLKEPLEIVKRLVDIEPDWVKVQCDNKKLRFYEAACFSSDTNHLEIVIRKSFLNNLRYLFLYKRSEVISHELLHLGRMAFTSNRFEEFFAYQTSGRFRSTLGPAFQGLTQRLIIAYFGGFFFVMSSSFSFFSMQGLLHFCKFFSIFYLSNSIFELICFKSILRIVRFKLKKISSCRATARAILYRLTDAEIMKFFLKGKKSIRKYIEEQKDKSLRWKSIYLSYF